MSKTKGMVIKMCKFSVIVPIYNVEDYIEDCVNSVLMQSYDNFELILVNDASPDSSLAIIQEKFQNHPNVQIIDKQENEGVALARSTGLSYAIGEYVIYLDGDDLLVQNALEVLDRKITATEAEVVIFPKIRERKGEKFVASYFEEDELFVTDKTRLYEGFLRYGYFAIGYSAIRRDLALKYDMARELSSIWLGEDLIQSLPILTFAKSVLYITEGLYIMTYNPDSVTRIKNLKMDRYLQASATHNYIADFMKKWNIDSLNEVFQEHVMRDAIVYACDGIWSTNSLSDGTEYLKTIGTDVRFLQAYENGYPKKKSSKLLAFLLKNQLWKLSYIAIKIKGWRVK
ncbi:glycosyltransferase family 2 protein [Streptococcus sp. 121]|uniref:glycosyltransferase family 2 protein n=1 Tax=Streptococcus sp. 121 TaxID=2797637 RepID=UPI0018F0CBDA|nr:glycosyltransferase family 2 protein [Streptococcus sp. 121]MBJ6746085.1 glycosyltransferase family 2 protein [Streptococcus sp. 121]